MALLLALAAALGWGGSDYAAGRASSKSSVLSVVVVAHSISVVTMGLVAIRWSPPHVAAVLGSGGDLIALDLALGAPSIVGSPGLANLLWGAAAGMAGGLGAALLFRGLSRGATALVAPISALGGAALPIAWAIATGVSLTLLSGTGLVLGLVAILLVSMTAGGAGSPDAAHEAIASSSSLQLSAHDGAARGSAVPRHTGEAPRLFATPVAVDLAERPTDAGRQGPRSRGPAVSLIGISAIAGSGAAAMPALASMARGEGLSGSSAATLIFTVVAACTGLGGLASSRAAPGAADGVHLTAVAAERRRSVELPGLSDALLSGIGFGLFFILLDQTTADAGLWPLLSARGVSVVMFAIAAAVTGTALFPPRGSRAPSLIAGVLDAVATIVFAAAAGSGTLSVVVVLVSLFPAVTVVLARFIDDERLTARQLVGLGVAGVAVGVLVLAR